MDGGASSSFPPSAGRMESKGQKWKPQKTVYVSGDGEPTSLPLPCCPSFIFSPFHSPLNFPSPTFPPLPLVSSRVYRGGALRSFWFRAQMALACLWQRIKPPVSPFASMCKRSGQRTSNRRRKKKGGRNVRERGREERVGEKEKKKKNLRLCETTLSADVSRHSWKSELKLL